MQSVFGMNQAYAQNGRDRAGFTKAKIGTVDQRNGLLGEIRP